MRLEYNRVEYKMANLDYTKSEQIKMPVNQKKNIEWVEKAKGIGILLVILGHSIRDGMRSHWIYNLIYTFIYTFHMPLFFMISGFLFERSLKKGYSYPELLKKKTRSVAVPFISYSVLIYMIFIACNCIPYIGRIIEQKIEIPESFVSYLLNVINGNNPLAFHLWYLLVLYLIEVISITMNRILNRNRMDLILLCATGFVAYVFGFYIYASGKPVNSMTANLLLKSIVFFSVGQCLCLYYRPLIRIGRKTGWIAGMVLLVYSTGIISIDDKAVGYIGVQTGLLISKIVFVLGIFAVCGMMKEEQGLAVMGRKSFSIYLLHQPFFCTFIGLMLYDFLKLPSILVLLICSISSICGPWAIVRIAERNKATRRLFRFLFNIG